MVNIFQWKTTSRDKKLTLIFFSTFRGYLSLSIKIRIEEHFFCLNWEMKGHSSFVNLWEAFALHKIYTWPVSFNFPMQKSVFQSLIVTCYNNDMFSYLTRIRLTFKCHFKSNIPLFKQNSKNKTTLSRVYYITEFQRCQPHTYADVISVGINVRRIPTL